MLDRRRRKVLVALAGMLLAALLAALPAAAAPKPPPGPQPVYPNVVEEVPSHLQIQNDQGPCLECYRSGEPVMVTDLFAVELRWPRFTAQARRQGSGKL